MEVWVSIATTVARRLTDTTEEERHSQEATADIQILNITSLKGNKSFVSQKTITYLKPMIVDIK